MSQAQAMSALPRQPPVGWLLLFYRMLRQLLGELGR